MFIPFKIIYLLVEKKAKSGCQEIKKLFREEGLSKASKHPSLFIILAFSTPINSVYSSFYLFFSG